MLAAVLVIAILLLWPDLNRGWAAQDEGGLAQVAERVLRGQMPHRDFDDPWTGGWSYFQAAIFGALGAKLSIVRLPIFLAWLSGLVAGYRLMRRLASPTLSGGVALACGLWSLYASHLPLLSWYYFPLSLITCWCATRYAESHRRGWLLLAGLLIGMLLLVKITAVFLLAGVLLWMLAVASEAGEETGAGPRGFFIVVAGSLLVFLAAVVLLIRALPAEMQGAAFVHFLLPHLLLAAWLLRNASRFRVATAAGVRTLLGLVVFLGAGVALALVPYVAMFAWKHELPALVAGVFVKPGVRLAGFALGAPGRLGTALALVAPVLLVAGCRVAKQAGTRRELVLATLCGAALGALAFVDETMATAGALTIRSMPVILPLALLWWEDSAATSASMRSMVILVVSVAVTAQLAQMPYSAYVYFLYVAPLGILATVALMRARLRAAPVAAFWTAMLLVSGLRPAVQPGETLHSLALRRGDIQVSLLDSVRYGRMAAIVASRPAGPIFVFGDHPELPFLLERPNASRMIYDVIADSAVVSPGTLLGMLDSNGVRTVIIAHRGGARGERDAPQIEALRGAFSCGTTIGRFEVRVRDSSAATPAVRSGSCAPGAAPHR